MPERNRNGTPKQLTGHDVAKPTQRLTLEAAVLGVRLLDRPHRLLAPAS